MKSEKEIQNRFKVLHEQFLEGKCSVSELKELEALMEQNDSANSIKNRMLLQLDREDYSGEGVFNKNKLFDRIISQVETEEKPKEYNIRRLYVNFIRVAAILLSFVAGGSALYLYQANFNQVERVPEYCEIVTPLGAKTKVVLPDSSVVMLNAGSKLRYSNLFNEKNRDLSLEGEAYFKVAKNKDIPFVVNAFGFEVEAVGTEFNVKAYKEEKVIETSLVEGKVKLSHKTEKIAKNIYLNPNHKATFYKVATNEKKKPRLIINTNVDLSPILAWRENQLILDKELLKDLAVKLERMYDCKFHFGAEEIMDYEFTGTIHNLTLKEIMEIIKISSPIKYDIKGNDVFVEKDKKRTQNFSKL